MRTLLRLGFLGMMLSLSASKTTPSAQADPKPVKQLELLTAKYLPGYSVRPEDRRGSWPTYVLIGLNGKPVPGVPGWQGLKGLTVTQTEPNVEYFGNPKINALLRESKLRVTTAEEAMEVEKCVRCLCRWGPPPVVEEWEYKAEPISGGWLIKPKYIGPPAKVQFRGEVEVMVDREKNFLELRDRRKVQ